MKFDSNEIKPIVRMVLEASLMEISDEEMPKMIDLIKSKFDKLGFEDLYEQGDEVGLDALIDLITNTVNDIVKHHTFKSSLKYTNNENQVSDGLFDSYLSAMDIDVKRIPHPLLKDVNYAHLDAFFSSYERKDLVFNLKDYLGPNYLYASTAQNENDITKINISDIEKRLKLVYYEIKKIIMYYRVKNKVQDDINIYFPMVSIYKHIPEAHHLDMHKSGFIISFALAGVDPYDIVKDIQKEKIDINPGLYGVFDGCLLYSNPLTINIGKEEYYLRNMVIDQSFDINFIV